MPGLVVGAIWSWILAGDFGVLNTVLKAMGLIDGNIFWKSDPAFSIWAVVIANIWLGLAFNMLLLSVGLAAIPRDLYEAAELDGANAFQRFWTITLPMMRSTIGAVLSLGLIGTLQQFDLFPAITEGGPASTSGAISLVKRSTAARSCPRTPQRTVTSGRSAGMGPASGPWQAFQPTYSVWISSKRSPSRSRRSRRMRSAACAFSMASGQA